MLVHIVRIYHHAGQQNIKLDMPLFNILHFILWFTTWTYFPSVAKLLNLCLVCLVLTEYVKLFPLVTGPQSVS